MRFANRRRQTNLPTLYTDASRPPSLPKPSKQRSLRSGVKSTAVAPSPSPSPTRVAQVVWPPKEHSAPLPHPSAPGRLVWRSAVSSSAGATDGVPKPNQDAALACDAWRSGPRRASETGRVQNCGLFAVFDGHGPRGAAVSGLAARKLSPALAAAAAAAAETDNGASVPRAALSAAFAALDGAARSGPSASCGTSGSTATVAVVEPSTDGHATGVLRCGWVGDSRAVIARAPPRRLSRGDAAPCEPGTLGGSDGGGPCPIAVDVTRDHKPTLAGEHSRLMAAGARVCPLTDVDGAPVGPARVWLPAAWVPGLAMSRALGDGLARRVGVVTTPDVVSLPLDPRRDLFAIFATDGVWEFLSSQEAVDIVSTARTPADGARALVAASRARWAVEEEGAVDDVTAVIVQFGWARESRVVE